MGVQLGLGGAVEEGREEVWGWGGHFGPIPREFWGVNFGRLMEVIWMAKILFGG
jgi:hypothetical protein